MSLPFNRTSKWLKGKQRFCTLKAGHIHYFTNIRNRNIYDASQIQPNRIFNLAVLVLPKLYSGYFRSSNLPITFKTCSAIHISHQFPTWNNDYQIYEIKTSLWTTGYYNCFINCTIANSFAILLLPEMWTNCSLFCVPLMLSSVCVQDMKFSMCLPV